MKKEQRWGLCVTKIHQKGRWGCTRRQRKKGHFLQSSIACSLIMARATSVTMSSSLPSPVPQSLPFPFKGSALGSVCSFTSTVYVCASHPLTKCLISLPTCHPHPAPCHCQDPSPVGREWIPITFSPIGHTYWLLFQTCIAHVRLHLTVILGWNLIQAWPEVEN